MAAAEILVGLILLIDDFVTVREVLRVALESEGYRVLEAADGREGVRLCREHKPTFVVVELALQGMNGFEVCWSLKELDPRPVIYTVSDERSDSAGDHNEVARMLGARRVFEKPVAMKELLGALRGVVGSDARRG